MLPLLASQESCWFPPMLTSRCACVCVFVHTRVCVGLSVYVYTSAAAYILEEVQEFLTT